MSINVAGGQWAVETREREIGSRALRAGRTGGCLAGRPMGRAGTPRWGEKSRGESESPGEVEAVD